jgi:hypothetical protein
MSQINVPPGMFIAGNFGDGLWRFGFNERPQIYLGRGWTTKELAANAAWKAHKHVTNKE